MNMDYPQYPRGYEEYQQGKYSLIQWLNTDEDLFIFIECVLRGWEYKISVENDRISYVISKENASPVCNEKGVQAILQFIRAHLNKNVRMSNVNMREVYRDVLEVALDFNEILFKNLRNWDFKIEYYEEIMNIVSYAVWFSFNRAKDEGERAHISKTYREEIIKQATEQKSEKGFSLREVFR